jgi:hypothetical protein
MQKVMSEIVTHISKDAAAEDGCCGVPVVEEDCVGELPEGRCECNEEGGWHDQSIFVHGKVMMDTMEEKM